MRHKDPCSCANRGDKNGDILRVGKLTRSFAAVRRRAVDLDWNRTKELLEERCSFRQVGCQILPDLGDGGFGERQAEETEFAEYQDHMTGAGAGEKSGDQDVRVNTDE
jgi:hypothetical protein